MITKGGGRDIKWKGEERKIERYCVMRI